MHDELILALPAEEKLRLIAEIAKRYKETDENVGDICETYDTIQWIATAGREGQSWGHQWIYKDICNGC